MVQATLNLLNEALTNNEQHDYYCLISGSDYPLKSQTFIEHYLEVNHGKEFINLVEMPSKKASKPLTRISRYYTDAEEIQKYHIPRLLAHIIARIVNTLHLKRDYKEALQGMKPYAGSQWWMLTQDSIQHILKFVSETPRFVDFFKNTQIPDESFFQIIIGNSAFKDKIARNVTFADWSLGKRSPAIIDDNHIQYFTNENVVADDVYGKGALFFARKFPNDSDRLIELIQHN
ncbi:putative glycosyltransferase [uncultured Candidatus Thioglobus sp.]|nr:putative glycosyltransferase [uncultured Candidatus Thioglobus sp.]